MHTTHVHTDLDSCLVGSEVHSFLQLDSAWGVGDVAKGGSTAILSLLTESRSTSVVCVRASIQCMVVSMGSTMYRVAI